MKYPIALREISIMPHRLEARPYLETRITIEWTSSREEVDRIEDMSLARSIGSSDIGFFREIYS